MKVRLALTLTVERRQPNPAEDVTVDLTGTYHDIPTATYDTGFHPTEERQ